MRPFAATLVLLATFVVPLWLPDSEAGPLEASVTRSAPALTNPWPDMKPIPSIQPITLEFAAYDGVSGTLGPWTTNPGEAGAGVFRVTAPENSLVHLLFELYIKSPDPQDPDYEDLLDL